MSTPDLERKYPFSRPRTISESASLLAPLAAPLPTRDLPLREAAQRLAPDPSESFDIAATYNAILASDPDVTKPVAAIEALIALLGATKSTTVFETIELVRIHSDRLKAAVANPVPLQAGTDLFLHNLVVWLRTHQDAEASASFEDVRQNLLRNVRLSASHALEARDRVAERGWKFVRDGDAVLTHGASRAVIGLLGRAAVELGRKRGADRGAGPGAGAGFSVVYVRDEARAGESDRVVAELRGHGIPVAEISMASVAHVLSLPRRVRMVLLGAEAVTHDGGVISRMGTFQIARLASLAERRPVLVATETHKFVRKLPADHGDLGFGQDVLDFRTEGRGADLSADAVDYTPAELIKYLITEDGVRLPSFVCEQLLQLYGTLAT